MELSYWQSRWEKDKTGWHMEQVFPPLRSYWRRLGLAEEATVLVPLCGKSLDIDWLASHNYHVIGVEVSKKALNALKDRLPYTFKRSTKGSFLCFRSEQVTLWCGDFFKIHPQWLPAIDAVYDKAALIALPPNERRKYAEHLLALISQHTQIFINCFEYEQNEMPGPPFAVMEKELRQLFSEQFNLQLLEEHSLFDELTNFQRRGLQSYLREKIYQLKPD